MYFANFPKIVYDFDLSGGTDYRVVTDITRNVRLRKYILENISLFDYYDVAEGETPEIISEKIYGTPYYHWVIMLVNQRYDYVNDFPLSQIELDAHIKRKYTEQKMYNVHHYKVNSVVKEGVNILKIIDSPLDGGTIGGFTVGDIIEGQTNKYLARVEQILETTTEYVIMKVSLREGRFVENETILGVYENINAIVQQCTIPQEYTTVSNYDYEFAVNEAKRRIKIVDPKLIDQVIREFEDIL